MFSDECHVELGVHGQIWVQRPVGAALDCQYMSNKSPHPDRISIWACFSRNGLGNIAIFTDNLNANNLRKIFSAHLTQSYRQLFPSGSWWLLFDNDPKHRSDVMENWLFCHGIECIDFPPYSPDLNPIENLWNDLKRRVEKHNASSIEELKQYLIIEWQATSTDFIANLSDSMPRRCKAVIANKGHLTRY